MKAAIKLNNLNTIYGDITFVKNFNAYKIHQYNHNFTTPFRTLYAPSQSIYFFSKVGGRK